MQFGEAGCKQATASGHGPGSDGGACDAKHDEQRRAQSKGEQTMAVPQAHGDPNRRKYGGKAQEKRGQYGHEEKPRQSQFLFLQLDSNELQPRLCGTEQGVESRP